MTHDLVIRNGQRRRRHRRRAGRRRRRDRRRPHHRGRRRSTGAATRELDADGRLVTPGLRRHPHPPRRAARVGPDRLVVVLARRHVGRARQLRRDVRAVQAGGPPVPGRDDGVGRGHPGRLDHGRARLGLGVLRRVPRRGRPHAEGHQRRRHGRALRGAHPRDGRAGARRGARDRGGRRRDVRRSSPRRSTPARSASRPRAPRCTACPTVASCPARYADPHELLAIAQVMGDRQARRLRGRVARSVSADARR